MPEFRPQVADRDELLRLLTESARSGSVSAMRALLEELRRDQDESPVSAFEALDNVREFRAR